MKAAPEQSDPGPTLPGGCGEFLPQLAHSGFTTIPGPLPDTSLDDLAEAYDEAMATASGPDLRVGSTTTRWSDLLSHSPVFDIVFLYSPLLQACRQLVGEPFKLSSFLGRTLRADTPAQELHVDLPRDSDDAPMLGFILMVDGFTRQNGATRFVPGSHRWPDLPADRVPDCRKPLSGEVLTCGEPGSMVLFDAAVWHSHTANVTAHPRRSIQGYFVRRSAHFGFDFRNRLSPAARSRMSGLARTLLSLDDAPV